MRVKVTWEVITYHSGEVDIDDREWAEWTTDPATPERVAEFLRAGRESVSSYLPEDSRDWHVEEADLDERSVRPLDCPTQNVLDERPHSIVVDPFTWCRLYKGHPGEHLYEDD